jgi:hypothetical protein
VRATGGVSGGLQYERATAAAAHDIEDRLDVRHRYPPLLKGCGHNRSGVVVGSLVEQQPVQFGRVVRR